MSTMTVPGTPVAAVQVPPGPRSRRRPRSADDPPIIHGTCWAIAFNTLLPASRPATSLGIGGEDQQVGVPAGSRRRCMLASWAASSRYWALY